MSLLALDRSALAESPVIRVWRHREFALFMSGIAPFYVTNWMQRVGVGWLAWDLTHSPGWLGAVAAADLAPMLLIAPLAGALVDRWDPLKQMKLSLWLVLVQAFALAVLTIWGLMTIELLLVLAFVGGVIMPLYNAARQTIVPASVPRADFPSAVSLDSSFFHGSRFVGPMIAGITISMLGIGVTLFAFVIGTVVLLIQVHRMSLPPPAPRGKATSLLQDVAAGVVYARGQHGIFMLFLLLTVVSIVARPLQDFLPGFADKIFASGADGYALLTSSMGIGALIGSAWLAMRGHTRGLVYIVVVNAIGLAIAMLGFVATNRLWTGVAFITLAGFTLTVMSTGTSALVQTAVSDEMRGRVMSLFAMIYRGVPAIGALVIGLGAETVGLRSAFAACAVICGLVWLALAQRHRRVDLSLREMRR